MSIFSNFKDETAPALASIEADAAKAIEDGRQWIAGMLARLNDFKTALEKDIEDAESSIKQVAADAEQLIAGKKDTLAKVNAEIGTYSALPSAPAPAATEPASAPAAAASSTVDPAAPTAAPVEADHPVDPPAAVEAAEPVAAVPASDEAPAAVDPAPAQPSA